MTMMKYAGERANEKAVGLANDSLRDRIYTLAAKMSAHKKEQVANGNSRNVRKENDSAQSARMCWTYGWNR